MAMEPRGKKARQGGHDAVVSSRALPNLGNAMWVAVDPVDGETLFVCSHYAILAVSPTGVISLLAGGKQGFKDGVGRDARFNIPRGIAGMDVWRKLRGCLRWPQCSPCSIVLSPVSRAYLRPARDFQSYPSHCARETCQLTRKEIF